MNLLFWRLQDKIKWSSNGIHKKYGWNKLKKIDNAYKIILSAIETAILGNLIIYANFSNGFRKRTFKIVDMIITTNGWTGSSELHAKNVTQYTIINVMNVLVC